MKPLSSFFGLRLQTGVKIVCKSFIVLVTITMSLNLYTLDYEGPREESIIALGLVLIFLTLLTGSALTGHSGADREGLCLVVLSLCLLVLAIVHWIVLGVVSMQKGDPNTVWQVCIQNRCAESFWTLDFGYRITAPKKDADVLLKRKQMPRGYGLLVNGQTIYHSEDGKINQSVAKRSCDLCRKSVQSKEKRQTHPSDYDEGDDWIEGGLDARMATLRPVEFWQRFTERDYESNDPATGVSLLITLIFLMLIFVYFFTCATVICSYSSELYDSLRDYDFEEEEAEEEEPERSENLMLDV